MKKGYVISWAEYNYNENANQLTCGAFRPVHPTAEAARKDVMDAIRVDAENDLADIKSNGYGDDLTVEGLVKDYIVSDDRERGIVTVDRDNGIICLYTITEVTME